MADNILKRIIQLVLDRNAAKKAQRDVEDTTDGMDKSFKAFADKVAKYFAIAFLVDKVINFGKEAIKQAEDSQAAWSDLRVSIENAGDSFDGLEESLRATADAFQDATGKDDDAFAASLSRLVTLTDDTTASINNMGLVANVAAKFFKGDLEPATVLVAKAMNGNVAALQKMGIHAKDGQEALEILAHRSMGAAEARARTFAGQLEGLTEAWNDDVKAIGEAIIGSNGATSAFVVLRAAVKSLSEWISRNKEEISIWVTNGVKFAIDAADVFIRACQLLANTLVGTLDLAFGISAQAIAALVIGYVDAKEAAIGFLGVFGINKSDELVGTDKLRKNAEALREWGKAVQKAGEDAGEAAKKALTTPLFTSGQFAAPPKSPPLPGGTNTPVLGKNNQSDATKEVTKAIEDYQKSALAAANMQKVLGDSFDAIGAEIERTSKLLNVLAGDGIDPATMGFGHLQGRLAELITVIQPTSQVAKELAKALADDVATAAITMGTGVDTATTKLDLLKKEQSDVLAALNKLGDKLKDTKDYQAFAKQYADLTKQISDETKIQTAIDLNRELGKTLTTDLAVGALTGASAIEQLKRQQAAALEGFTNLAKIGDTTSESALRFAQNYRELTAAIEQAEGIKQTADAYRDLGDAIRASVFEESTHAITKLEMLKKQQDALGKAMLVARFRKDADALRDLEAQYQKVTVAIQEQTVAMQYQTMIADFLAEALGAAMQGGLGKAAAQKAKQLGIEAAEMGIRALVFAAFGNAPAAAASAQAAVAFGALALAWAGLAAAAGGSGSSGSVPSPSSSGSPSNSGEDLTQSRTATSRATSNSVSPSAEVSLYLVGPGFHALNPAVQRVVYGAHQQAQQRFGEDAVIRLRSTGE